MVNDYNEVSYAKYIIENGFLTKRKMYELGLISKYYIMLGKSNDEIFDLLIAFCEKNFEEFNISKYFDRLKKTIKKARTVPIHEIGSIKITNSDIDYINSFDETTRFKTVLFSLIVIKKIRSILNQPPYLNCKYSKFTKMCGLVSTKNIYPILKEMEDMGIIRVCRNSNIEILFSVDMTEESGVLFEVKDFDSLYCYYRNFLGIGRYIECSNCGKMTKTSNNRQKYCQNCSRKINIKKTMENRKKEKFE